MEFKFKRNFKAIARIGAKGWSIRIGLLFCISCFLSASDALGGVKLLPLKSFDGTNGLFPVGNLIQYKNGAFYGTSFLDEKLYHGTVFRVKPGERIATIVAFDGTNGSEPGAGLTEGNDGFFYGTTLISSSVSNYHGTIFKITPRGKLTTLFCFAGTNGGGPGGLTLGKDGIFYGITQYGGGAGDSDENYSGYGTVFKINPKGELTTLAVFNGTNGAFFRDSAPPRLAQADDGSIYGTTMWGGPGFSLSGQNDGYGTIFRIEPNGGFTTLFAFDGVNGAQPNGVIKAKDGNFYGTTYYGGTNNTGTIFRITTNGVFTTLYSFSSLDHLDSNQDGANPRCELVHANDGLLYGVTENGGENTFAFGYPGVGTIFKITTNGIMTPLISFGVAPDFYRTATLPNGLIQASNGRFYGTTFRGGKFNNSINGGDGSFYELSVVKPVSVITKPYQNAYTRSQSIEISGKTKAKGNGFVTNVFYQINGNGWIVADSNDGWVHWNASITLEPGINIISSYAVDSLGDASRTNSVKVRYHE